MREKVKTSVIVLVGIVGAVWLVSYWGGRAINFMVKLHGG